MASVAEGEREDSLLEHHRTSLLDVIEDKNRTLNKKTLLHRIVTVSKMRHQNFQEVGQYYEKFFKELQNTLGCEGVTGLLLLYPKHCVHVVETSEDVILELTKDMQHQKDDEHAHLSSTKILIISHNIPHRLYQHWSHRVLDIEAPRADEHESNEDMEAAVIDMLTNLLKLGTHLSRQPKMGPLKVALKTAMDSLHEKFPELLPQQGIIECLLSSENTDCILTPEEYLNIYRKPYETVLGSDLVWPMPVKLFHYN